jgi:hypothetical protein
MEETTMKKIDLRGIIIFVLSVVLTVGVKLLFHACGAKDDGSYMSCHWAEQAVFGVGIVLVLMSAIHIAVRKTDTKKGVSLAIIPAALLNVFIPNILINLCMMSDMRCRSIMKPAVSVIGIIIAAVAVIDAVMLNKESK